MSLLSQKELLAEGVTSADFLSRLGNRGTIWVWFNSFCASLQASFLDSAKCHFNSQSITDDPGTNHAATLHVTNKLISSVSSLMHAVQETQGFRPALRRQCKVLRKIYTSNTRSKSHITWQIPAMLLVTSCVRCDRCIPCTKPCIACITYIALRA